MTGNIASINGHNGSISRTFDPAGRLLGVITDGYHGSIQYDGFGRKTALSGSDGIQGEMHYDLLDRMSDFQWTKGKNIALTQAYIYNAAGNITDTMREITEQNHSRFGAFRNGRHQAHEKMLYDADDQLIQANGPLYSRAFQYDLLGNRIKDSEQGTGTFVANFLVKNSSENFTSDPDGFGDLVKESGNGSAKNYTYRADGKLVGFQEGALTVSYSFDALGRRIAKLISHGKKTNDFSQSYLHLEEEDRILFGKAGDGNIAVYLDGQGVDEHLAEVNEKTVVTTVGTGKNKHTVTTIVRTGKTYVTDHLGSVLNSPAAGGQVAYGLFGETAELAVAASSKPVRYGFAGRELDESGLYYNRARNYSPSTGRWLSQDPIGYSAKDSNYYRYVFNKPLRYTDPSGLYCSDTVNDGLLFMIGGLAAGIVSPPIGAACGGAGIGMAISGAIKDCPPSMPVPKKPDPEPKPPQSKEPMPGEAKAFVLVVPGSNDETVQP